MKGKAGWAATVVACAAVCLTWALAAGAQETPERQAYEQCLTAGDYAMAVEAGRPIVEALRAAHPGSKALSTIDERLAAIEDAKFLAVYKLDMIAEGVASGHASLFQYVTPTPSELFAKVRRDAPGTAFPREGLSAEEVQFARSYLEAALRAADCAVVDAYLKAAAGQGHEEAAAKARAYMSAYFIGAHDDRTYPAALSLLGERVTGGALPVFLADDALDAIADVRACAHVMDVLDAVPWARWPQGEELRLYKAMAAAAQRDGNNEWAVMAYSKIAAKGAPAEAEEAQGALIKLYGEKMKDYSEAARACGDYLKRFPDGRAAVQNEYLKALYEWQANSFQQALADAKAFEERHPDSGLMPNAMLLEGLACNSQGKVDDAVKAFKELITGYPKHKLAAKAEYLIGVAYMSGQRYREARDAFQRVVDFYPGDPNAAQAKDYVNRLKDMPSQSPR